MGEDASLDDFVDSGSGDADGSDDESADAEPSNDRSDSDHSDGADATSGGERAVEAATATYRVTTTPEACPACGDRACRFWNDDGTFVCGNCKAW